MNPDLKRLYDIASKKERIIIGLMSGTSLDGLDVALCRFRGSGPETGAELLEFRTVAYPQTFKDQVRAVFARRQVDLQQVCMLHPWIGLQHAEMVLDCLQAWSLRPEEVDLIASHGQTVYHAPRRMHGDEHFGDSTLQLGDGDHIAARTGIITISDFRQKHIAAGGEGAPLAVYGDYLLFSNPAESRILLNIGGIANFTFLPAVQGASSGLEVYSSDVGPGNTLIDATVRRYFPGKAYDKDGAIARQGNVSQPLLQTLKDHPFLQERLPKTTGPELFNPDYVEKAMTKSGTSGISPEDLVATLTAFSARCIADTLYEVLEGQPGTRIYLSGGGMHNPVLIANLRQKLSGQLFASTAHLGIDPDAKEAVLFAALANETVAGEQPVFNGKQPNQPAVSMGKISFPG